MYFYTSFFFFFFNDTATTEIYTLSLHDALPIWRAAADLRRRAADARLRLRGRRGAGDTRGGRQARRLQRRHGNRDIGARSEEHTSELQSPCNLVCRLLLEKKKKTHNRMTYL